MICLFENLDTKPQSLNGKDVNSPHWLILIIAGLKDETSLTINIFENWETADHVPTLFIKRNFHFIDKENVIYLILF